MLIHLFSCVILLFQCISNFAHTWRALCVLIHGAPDVLRYTGFLFARARARALARVYVSQRAIDFFFSRARARALACVYVSQRSIDFLFARARARALACVRVRDFAIKFVLRSS